jgi:hypothetical protein
VLTRVSDEFGLAGRISRSSALSGVSVEASASMPVVMLRRATRSRTKRRKTRARASFSVCSDGIFLAIRARKSSASACTVLGGGGGAGGKHAGPRASASARDGKAKEDGLSCCRPRCITISHSPCDSPETSSAQTTPRDDEKINVGSDCRMGSCRGAGNACEYLGKQYYFETPNQYF